MPNDPAKPEQWCITFEAIPGAVPVAVRVRHLLKRALRDWGLRAISVRDAIPEIPSGVPSILSVKSNDCP